MSLSEAHKQKLLLKYGIPEEDIRIRDGRGELCSLLPDEVRSLSGRMDIDSCGLLFRYPGSGAYSIRLDTPPKDEGGREIKYLHPAGEPNHLFNPGVDLTQAQDIWIVEGEAKALCGYAHGLPILALSGVYNWRTKTEKTELLAEGEGLTDSEALLPELARLDWSGKRVILLYDSDIVPGHRAFDAFPRLAEQLYSLGAEKVWILSLPSVMQGQKTGLDEFFLSRKEQALQDLQAMKDRKEPYLPIRAGGLAYAERLIKSNDPDDKLRATIALLGAKNKAFVLEWLKEHGIKGEMRTALLQDAKEKLSQLQIRPEVPSSQSTLPALGPEYGAVRSLLKNHMDEFDLDERGRLSEVEWMEAKIEDGKPGYIRLTKHLCNFAAWPVREVLKDNGVSQERYLELRGLLQGGASLKPAKILLSDFLDKGTWTGQLWGARAAIKPYKDKDVRYCIQLMAQEDIEETVIFTHLGWRKINGKWLFLHAEGAVGSEAVEVELNDRLKDYVLPHETKNIKGALKASLSLLDIGPDKIMLPLLAQVYLAPLCEPLRQAGIEPSSVLFVWGHTGSLKSTIIALLLCHFGNFGAKGLPASFRDTAYSVEEMAFVAKDIPLPVEDLYPSKDLRERQKNEKVLEYLARNQGDRQGRGRLKATSELKTGHPPRGLIYCTGEYMPLSGSSLARNWVSHILKGDIDEKGLTLAQANQSLLSHAMRGYLEWLAPQIDTLPSVLKEDFLRLRDEAKKASKTRNRHRRLDETVAHLYLGFNLFVNYAESQGALSSEEAVKLLQRAWDCLNKEADELSLLSQREEPIKRFFEALLELQAQGRVYFANMKDEPSEQATYTSGSEKLGWGPDESGIYYLLYGPTWEAVTRYLRTQEDGLSLSKDALLDSIEQKGLLGRSQGNRRVINKTIAGKDYRVLPILEKAFKLEGEDDVQ